MVVNSSSDRSRDFQLSLLDSAAEMHFVHLSVIVGL